MQTLIAFFMREAVVASSGTLNGLSGIFSSDVCLGPRFAEKPKKLKPALPSIKGRTFVI